MPFSRTKTEPLDARCNVRVTASELAELREAAKLAGLSLSEYMRRRALGILVIAHSDLSVVRELRRLGGLLKAIHLDSKGAYSETTAGMLGDIGAYIRKVTAEPEDGER
jgi:hypothetical protein